MIGKCCARPTLPRNLISMPWWRIRRSLFLDEGKEKLIETDQFRKEEGRYSKRIPMERIKDEGYNLNISRYISTAIAESEIDLAATHGVLERIENTIQKATIKHNEFL